MGSGVRYRAASIIGTAAFTVLAVLFVNQPVVQETFALVPFFGNPAPVVLENGEVETAVVTAVVVMSTAMWPLFKPRPRRILDTIMQTQKRVLLGMAGLATLGYFKWSHQLPRSTLMLSTLFLLGVLPGWYLMIRRQPGAMTRAIVIGDDPEAMEAILDVTELPILGYVSPPTSYAAGDPIPAQPIEVADGGTVESRLDALPLLGGMSRLDEVLDKHDVDTVLLAFADTDRAEFFGVLGECYEHGVTAMVHREHADDVLTRGAAGGELVEIDLEPWDWQDHVLKRTFDVVFSVVGLIVLVPVIVCIAVAVKLEDGGPVLYGQERTATFGDTFAVYKFRSMVPDAERDGVKLSAEDNGDVDPRVTRVGRVLRQTHLDEIPQLWSVLSGDMSVVGPRPERPELDTDMEASVGEWRSRWFVKPGLTGLAQVNDVTGFDPERKLRYDVEYIRKQSFWFDLKIVVRQIWLVVEDIYESRHID